MLQLIATIIAGIATLTAISGILVLTNSWLTDYDIVETSNSRLGRTLELETDEDISSNNNSTKNSDGQFINNKSYAHKTQQNNNLAIINSLDAVKVHTYSNQATVLYNLYTQSALLNLINGVRAPPRLT